MQLFNVLQVNTDTGKLWNENFDRALSKVNIHRSMRDLEACARINDEDLVILKVSNDEILFCTNSTTVQSKLFYHLQKHLTLTTKKGPIIDYLNCRIARSKIKLLLIKQLASNPSQTTIFYTKIIDLKMLSSELTVKKKMKFLMQNHVLNLN